MKNEILDPLFGEGAQLPVAKEILIARILKDNLVNVRVQELLARQHVAEVLRDFHPTELKALAKRVCPEFVAPAATPSKADWAIFISQYNQVLTLRVTKGSNTTAFQDRPELLSTMQFFGESVPEDVLAEYTQRFKPHAFLRPQQPIKADPSGATHNYGVVGENFVPFNQRPGVRTLE